MIVEFCKAVRIIGKFLKLSVKLSFFFSAEKRKLPNESKKQLFVYHRSINQKLFFKLNSPYCEFVILENV